MHHFRIKYATTARFLRARRNGGPAREALLAMVLQDLCVVPMILAHSCIGRTAGRRGMRSRPSVGRGTSGGILLLAAYRASILEWWRAPAAGSSVSDVFVFVSDSLGVSWPGSPWRWAFLRAGRCRERVPASGASRLDSQLAGGLASRSFACRSDAAEVPAIFTNLAPIAGLSAILIANSLLSR